MKSLGLYCGTFDPFHKGHLNVYGKAARLFDEVIVAQGVNPDKDRIIEKPHVEGITIVRYDYLTTELIRLYAVTHEVTLVRGIRNGYDYDYEMNQINVMRDLYPDLQVILIPCDREFGHISSSMIRALQKFDKAAAQQYLP